MVNALAIGADEGRDEQRNAAGRCKYSKIRRYPNGGTHYVEDIVPLSEYIAHVEGTWWTETS